MTLEPLFLLPGLLCDRRLFGPQISVFSQERTVHVADTTRDDNFADMARRVLAEAPDSFVLAGLSMGGYLALEVIRQAPERVTRLALLDTNARADTPEQTQSRRDLIALAQRGRFHGVSDKLIPNFIHPRRLKDQGLCDLIRSMASHIGKDAFLRQETAILGRDDARDRLSAITCPTLALCGRQDVLTPPDRHQEIAERIPNATLVVLPDCGHLSTLEQPGKVTRQLKAWLED
ncbi:MAG: alpha/beta fold hydrolase [Pseudomonadota bacterium]